MMTNDSTPSAAPRRLLVNAPSAATAEAAVRAEMSKRGLPPGTLKAEPRIGQKPDDVVAVVVTKPAGPRSTFIVFYTPAEEIPR